jgi:hypothetical protein
MSKIKLTNTKPEWCSLNIQKINECMFEGICLAGGVCSFKKEVATKNNSASGRKLKRSPENRFSSNKRKKKKKKK